MTDLAQQDEELCGQASKFIKLFYDAMDRKREKTIHMYTEDEPNVVWNGNNFTGSEGIGKFLANFPVTQHEIVSLDAQKIPNSVTGGPDLLVLLVAGSVTVHESIHAFTETFTLVMEEMNLKVKSQRFRYVD